MVCACRSKIFLVCSKQLVAVFFKIGGSAQQCFIFGIGGNAAQCSLCLFCIFSNAGQECIRIGKTLLFCEKILRSDVVRPGRYFVYDLKIKCGRNGCMMRMRT